MMSNAAIVEEHKRLRAWSQPSTPIVCRTHGCANQSRPVDTHPDDYQRFGRTPAGSLRFRCRLCLSTVSQPVRASLRLRRPEKTEQILTLLINKMPMRRLCEAAGVRPETLYQRIRRLGAQCRSFMAAHEAPFLREAQFERLHLAIDRQDYMLNWGSALDRRITAIRSVASAEARSGYIVAQHLNYDPLANPLAEELLAREAGDPEVTPPFRRYPRLWLPYESADPAGDTSTVRLPGHGGIVHETYTIAAHVLCLAPWVERSQYAQLTLDREPSLSRLCVLAFADRVRAGSLDAFYVRINKDLTVAQRHQALARAEETLKELRTLHPTMDDAHLMRRVLADRYAMALEAPLVGRGPWIGHPYPTMSEPERAVQCLTATPERSIDQLVAGMARASLRSIDRYFMQLRRKINILERPLYTTSAAGRAWFGYSAYSPRVVLETLDIFRAVYNCHLRGQDRRTPAQRLGMLNAPVSLAELCAWQA